MRETDLSHFYLHPDWYGSESAGRIGYGGLDSSIAVQHQSELSQGWFLRYDDGLFASFCSGHGFASGSPPGKEGFGSSGGLSGR